MSSKLENQPACKWGGGFLERGVGETDISHLVA